MSLIKGDTTVFDIFYYDPLGRQNEEIRLTLDLKGEGHLKENSENLTPPLNHVLRTKWPKGSISWNGTDPLL